MSYSRLPDLKTKRLRRSNRQAITTINVTPFVDVMLVLLIVFMVTAPLLNVGVPVNLPNVSGTQVKTDDQPAVITIKANGQIFLQNENMDLTELNRRLTVLADNKNKKIYVRGDKNVAYGRMVEVMGLISGKGFNSVSLITNETTK